MLWRLQGTVTSQLMWLAKEVQPDDLVWTCVEEDARLFTDSEKAVAAKANCTEGCLDLSQTRWELVTDSQVMKPELECNCEVCQRKTVSLSETEKEITT